MMWNLEMENNTFKKELILSKISWMTRYKFETYNNFTY